MSSREHLVAPESHYSSASAGASTNGIGNLCWGSILERLLLALIPFTVIISRTSRPCPGGFVRQRRSGSEVSFNG